MCSLVEALAGRKLTACLARANSLQCAPNSLQSGLEFPVLGNWSVSRRRRMFTAKALLQRWVRADFPLVSSNFPCSLGFA